jgi:phosphoglycerate dehydrogenase-like enzyme
MAMHPINVIILTQKPLPQHLTEMLRNISDKLVIEARTADTKNLRDLWNRAEVLYTDSLVPNPEDAPDLRWIQTYYAGVDKLINAPILKQVILTSMGGIQAYDVAEHVITMILAFAHHLPQIVNNQQIAFWPAPEQRWDIFSHIKLDDCTLAVIGYGRIGREIAKLARTFGMRVLAVDIEAEEIIKLEKNKPGGVFSLIEKLLPISELKTALKASDFVALSVPLTKETQNLIGYNEIASMKPDAILINISRGQIIDEAALIEALKNQTIGGAALDVFTTEPLPSFSPFWSFPNVVVTPHIAGMSKHYQKSAMTLFAENLRRYVNGEDLINVLDLARGY